MLFDHFAEVIFKRRDIPQSHPDHPIAVIFVQPVSFHVPFILLKNLFLQQPLQGAVGVRPVQIGQGRIFAFRQRRERLRTAPEREAHLDVDEPPRPLGDVGAHQGFQEFIEDHGIAVFSFRVPGSFHNSR